MLKGDPDSWLLNLASKLEAGAWSSAQSRPWDEWCRGWRRDSSKSWKTGTWKKGVGGRTKCLPGETQAHVAGVGGLQQ